MISANDNDNESAAKKTILLVEDDKFIASVYHDKLTAAGYTVIIAEDGLEALEKIPILQPDLILLDIILPEKNGFEVLGELQSNNISKEIPVIILSNLERQQDVELGLKMGAREFLVKANITLDDLTKKVGKYL